MPRAKKTWTEKMQAKPPHYVILDKDFAGVPKGSKLHISCPVEVAAELKNITPGTIISIQAFRRKLAEKTTVMLPVQCQHLSFSESLPSTLGKSSVELAAQKVLHRFGGWLSQVHPWRRN